MKIRFIAFNELSLCMHTNHMFLITNTSPKTTSLVTALNKHYIYIYIYTNCIQIINVIFI